MNRLNASASLANSETSLVGYCHYNCDSRCCNSTLWLPGEYHRLMRRRLILNNDPSVIDKREYYILLADKNTGRCRFLKNNLCSIQALKPVDCKIWPLYYHPYGSNLNLAYYDSNCPIARILPNRFIGSAIREQKKVQKKFHGKFFNITVRMGYELKDVLHVGESFVWKGTTFSGENVVGKKSLVLNTNKEDREKCLRQ